MSPEDFAVLSGDSPFALLKRYRASGLPILLEFRDVLVDHFSREKALDLAREYQKEIVQYTWTAIVAPKVSMNGLHILLSLLGHVSIGVNHTLIEFSTFHSIPTGAYRRLRLRYFLSKGVHIFGIFFGIMGLVFLPCFAIPFFGNSISFQKFAEDRMFAWLCVLLVLWVLAVLGLVFEKRIALPAYVRLIGRYPFAVKSIKRLKN